MIMLTDKSGTFRGDETIRVRGVEVAVQRETARQRQIELLTATANPFDLQIMGPQGRAKLLRAVSDTVGIEDDIVPPEEDLPPVTPPGMLPPDQGQLPGPQNMDLGVPEGNAMRGMTGANNG
jgi:hypothetical protein